MVVQVFVRRRRSDAVASIANFILTRMRGIKFPIFGTACCSTMCVVELRNAISLRRNSVSATSSRPGPLPSLIPLFSNLPHVCHSTISTWQISETSPDYPAIEYQAVRKKPASFPASNPSPNHEGSYYTSTNTSRHPWTSGPRIRSFS